MKPEPPDQSDQFQLQVDNVMLRYMAIAHTSDADQIIEWFKAHGIDPKRVPVPSQATIANRQLTIELYALDEDGRKYLDESGEEVVRTTITVPLVADPPTCWVSRERIAV